MRIATRQIKTDSTMINFLQKSGVSLSNEEHASYKFQCCAQRSEHSSRTCQHGMMDLSVETWREENVLKVSVCHYYEQNGDLMRDPEMVFNVHLDLHGTTFPAYFRQDGMFAREDTVFFEENGKKLYHPKMLKSLKSFSRTWALNLRAQGHTLASEHTECSMCQSTINVMPKAGSGVKSHWICKKCVISHNIDVLPEYLENIEEFGHWHRPLSRTDLK